jgi:hypothetical protein
MKPPTIYDIVIVIAQALVITSLVSVFAFLLMWLYNMLIPAITGWQEIGFFQAIGLFVLIFILTFDYKSLFKRIL